MGRRPGKSVNRRQVAATRVAVMRRTDGWDRSVHAMKTPFFPPSGPATGFSNGPHPKSNFLAVSPSDTPSIRPSHAAATPRLARKAGSTAVAISCDQSLKRLANPMPNTVRLHHLEGLAGVMAGIDDNAFGNDSRRWRVAEAELCAHESGQELERDRSVRQHGFVVAGEVELIAERGGVGRAELE